MTLADRLVELRVRRGLSQEQLSERSGVSVRTIGDLERGTTRRPHRETLRALVDALDLDPAGRTAMERLARSAPPAVTRRTPRRPPALAAPITTMVGRDRDLHALTGLVRARAHRLVTVTGPGGVGKSRLALETGWRAAGVFEHVAGIDLSGVPRPDDVLRAMAETLGCRMAGLAPADALAATIGDARWLLVLDSVERVLAAAPDLSALLARCRALTVLATSRMPLSLRGEHLWPLSPLASDPAVALLVQRTAAVRPGFAITDGNAAAVAQVCRRLDGLPLAIELAAARLRTREPDDLLRELAARLPDLTGAVDGPDRHQTLRRTVEWSTDHLAAPHRRLLGLLAVFTGGADPADVRAVLARSGAELSDGDASIGMLVAGSLVTVADRDGRARIGLLDTIREVALDLAGDADRDAHAAHFLALVRDGGDAGGELGNVRAAVDRARAARPDLLDVPTIRALNGFYLARAMFTEAAGTLSGVAAAVADGPARAWALHGAAIAANESGASASAVRAATGCAEMFERLGDDLGRCMALTVLGNAHKFLGDYPAARAAHTGGLELARKLGDDRRVTISLNNLGTLAHDRGEWADAREHYTQSLAIKVELGDARGIAIARMNLGGVENDLGRYADAYAHLESAVAHLRTADDPAPASYALAMLAEALLGLGRPADAAARADEALHLARTADYRPGIAMALARLGDLAVVRGDRAAATVLLRQALDDAAGPPEQARILDRLADAADPAGAADFRRRAALVRAEHDLPAAPGPP